MSDLNIEKLLEILPKLIRENDTVKGAIISALSGVVATKDDIQDLIKVMNERFNAMQERLDNHLDKRFNAMQEQMDKRFNAMQEQMDKRFNAMQEQMDKRFNVMRKENGEQFQTLTWNLKNLEVAVARIESKEGIYFEQTVLELMKETLKMENISVDNIRKEYIADKEGVVFFPGYTTDIDVLAEDSHSYLIEVKVTASSQDVVHFLQNARLFEKVRDKKPTQLVMIALRIQFKAQVIDKKLGIRVIAAKVLSGIED